MMPPQRLTNSSRRLLTVADNVVPRLRQIVERAHAAGVKVAGATITPFAGSSIYSPEAEVVRQSINTWIRASGTFDALVDFDRIVRDPQRPERALPRYGDGLTIRALPAMADEIDLLIFANANRKD
jgi:hypothetical protein